MMAIELKKEMAKNPAIDKYVKKWWRAIRKDILDTPDDDLEYNSFLNDIADEILFELDENGFIR